MVSHSGSVDGVIQDDWDTVLYAINNGLASKWYNIGDIKEMSFSEESGISNINMQIVAFNSDELSDGSGYAQTTWISKELLPIKTRMNPSVNKISDDPATYEIGTGTIGGWEKCEMRNLLSSTILPSLPEEVSSNIKSVTKYSSWLDTDGSKVRNGITSDHIWIPSAAELYGLDFMALNQYPRENAGVSYSSVFPNKRKEIVNETSHTMYWTRTAFETKDTNSYYVVSNMNGTLTSARASSTTPFSIAIAIGFCI